ncbi:PHP domain-containing protein [Ruminococcaceae bacterium OttesenSCG-928-L11]|nr:PHP domain-containing protein [Ruminococcaceae bacterium OttesenSCG-928-L11]
MAQIEALIERLNAPTAEERLAALEQLKQEVPPPAPTGDVNNHIHTMYSFSPYSPTKAAYMAWSNGLTTAGIMDHDSVAGAEEFIRAGEILGIATTVGFECRCRMDNTPFAGKRINNPDQTSVAYLAAHGIPHQNIARAQEWLSPYRAKRNERNRKMTANINTLLAGTGVSLDFDRDIEPLSLNREGGSITERHILFALSRKLMAQIGTGAPLLAFLEQKLAITVTGKNRDLLAAADDGMYDYYLLGVLKGSMVEQFYVDADAECPDVAEFIAFTKEIGAISAYAYLGDVGDSVTGDKKAQTFEDSYLDELVPWLSQAGFSALTYMPTRNTRPQLERVMALCDAGTLFQISGEDINSPFQSFRCAALQEDAFRHLIDSTWALIGHERAATANQQNGMFTAQTIAALPTLPERIRHFAQLAQSAYR